MYAQLSEQYRMIGRSLYEKRGNSFFHCAVVPVRIKSLAKAVEWYEQED